MTDEQNFPKFQTRSCPSLQEVESHMHEALRLAASAIGLTDPNPRVGCVIADKDGVVIGRGYTQKYREAHAEVVALADAHRQGQSVVGATAYVTLEPCAHHGQTPPCCEALAKAGIGRVVIAHRDPNRRVNGEGIARLRHAGVLVTELSEGPLWKEAYELNIGFFFRMQHGRPWVRLKAAMSLDGTTALRNGASQWITREAARVDGHVWRRRASAILTGVGTVLGDNPRLDVRLVSAHKQPLRVIVDSHLLTPLDARILQPPGQVLVYTSEGSGRQQSAMEALGAEISLLPSNGSGVDLDALLADLGRRGVNELHVEAGQRLNGSLVNGGYMDELLLYVAPSLLGPGYSLAACDPLNKLSEAIEFEYHDVAMVGKDLRIIARRR
jgi:diaminohydroxyphosphoribosylaminopyrimidine deaminase/5-amino-6-(5-phosphoribosylamino)uracil reductase